MNINVRLTFDEIDVNDIVKKCIHPSGGAVTTFVGTTREYFEDDDMKKDVTLLSYEAADELALLEMNDICEDALQKYGGLKASIVHRLGEVKVEEISIVCCISTPHRKEGFEACEWMMKDLKKRVAVWKKEIFTDGTSLWKENIENDLKYNL